MGSSSTAVLMLTAETLPIEPTSTGPDGIIGHNGGAVSHAGDFVAVVAGVHSGGEHELLGLVQTGDAEARPLACRGRATACRQNRDDLADDQKARNQG